MNQNINRLNGFIELLYIIYCIKGKPINPCLNGSRKDTKEKIQHAISLNAQLQVDNRIPLFNFY